MSNLQSLLTNAKEGLALGQPIPHSRWPAIAAQLNWLKYILALESFVPSWKQLKLGMETLKMTST
jgi:hypothetical protein